MANGDKELELSAGPAAGKGILAIQTITTTSMPPNCPPPAAADDPMTLFRLSSTGKPSASDCLTAEESNSFLNADPCRRKSVSSYSDRLGAEQVRRRVPHFVNHHICRGVVPSGMGVHLSTPSKHEKSHWSWWPKRGIRRQRFFSVVP